MPATSAGMTAERRYGAGQRPQPVFSLTAQREFLALSFRQEARLRHIQFWNACPFKKRVLSFLSVTLHAHQFVIKSRCIGPWPRQRKGARDLFVLIRRYLGDSRRRNKPPF